MRPAVKVWDADTELWAQSAPKNYDGAEWRRPAGEYTYAGRTPFHPDYLGDGSVLKRSVVDMPIATNSTAQSAWMAANINYGGGFGDTSFNTSVFGTHPVALYVVDSRIMGNHRISMKVNHPSLAAFTRSVLEGWIPWPEWVDPSTLQVGQDSSVAIYDIGTGIMREYYMVARVTGYANKYTAGVGGYTIYPRGTTALGDHNYALQLTDGMNTVVRMHNSLGFVDIGGARNGVIDHALAFTCSNMALPDSAGEAIRPDGTRYTTTGASWPAVSGDGDTANPSDLVPIHGQWTRLPAAFDTSGFRPFLRVILEAVKTYGMFASDSNNFVHAFNAEPGFAEKHFLGVDPWSAAGDIYKKYDAANVDLGLAPGSPFNLAAFPWGSLEWAPRNWGKPE